MMTLTRLALLTLTLCLPVSASETIIKLGTYGEHTQAINNLFLNTQQCHEQSLIKQANIHLMEVVLLCKALKIGGLNVTFKTVPMPNQERAVRAMSKGEITMFANSVWSYLKTDQILISRAIMPYGSYEKGIYMAASHPALKRVHSDLSIKELFAVVGTSWQVDRKVLDCFNIQYETVSSYPQMLRMTQTKRVDFILHNFTSYAHLGLEEFETHLVPINGLKFSMPDSLHYFVSAKHPDGANVYAALQHGLNSLNAQGDIVRAYTSIGMYNPKVRHWESLSCPVPL